MIEVFKTNVNDRIHAAMIVTKIQENFLLYEANFDLQDCDRILRVKSMFGSINSHDVIQFIHESGFRAEVLPDQFSVEGATLSVTHSFS
ncbi:MAG: hypothetical protein WKF87_14150 [Chryseolinea sp.]